MIGEVEQEKEAIVAEVEPLRELKTGIDEIDTTGTKLPFGVVAIKKKDLEAVKYGISNLSKAQGKLIDGLAEYGAEWAKADGFPEMAEEMEKRVGISKGIEKIVEPPAPKRSKGWEMEL